MGCFCFGEIVGKQAENPSLCQPVCKTNIHWAKRRHHPTRAVSHDHQGMFSHYGRRKELGGNIGATGFKFDSLLAHGNVLLAICSRCGKWAAPSMICNSEPCTRLCTSTAFSIA